MQRLALLCPLLLFSVNMKTPSQLLAVAAFTSSVFAAPSQTFRSFGSSSAKVAASNSSIPVPALNSLAQAAGLKYFGTAVDNPDLQNPEYVQYAFGYAPELFGQVTPANGQKVRTASSLFS